MATATLCVAISQPESQAAATKLHRATSQPVAVATKLDKALSQPVKDTIFGRTNQLEHVNSPI